LTHLPRLSTQEEKIRAMAMEQKRQKLLKDNNIPSVYIHRPEISTINLVL
jgi:hypothetical protein